MREPTVIFLMGPKQYIVGIYTGNLFSLTFIVFGVSYYLHIFLKPIEATHDAYLLHVP